MRVFVAVIFSVCVSLMFSGLAYGSENDDSLGVSTNDFNEAATVLTDESDDLSGSGEEIVLKDGMLEPPSPDPTVADGEKGEGESKEQGNTDNMITEPGNPNSDDLNLDTSAPDDSEVGDTSTDSYTDVPEILERVEDGAYVIESELGFSLDVAGASTNNGANIQIYADNYSAAQRFYIKGEGQIESGEWYYSFKNANSGKMLDVWGGETTPKTNVWQYTQNDSGAQRWFLRKTKQVEGINVFQIVNAMSGLALDVAGAEGANSANVWIYTPNGTIAQNWFLKKCVAEIADGAYIIESNLPGSLVVDIYGSSGENNVPIWLYGNNGTLAQSFGFSYDEGTGYYTVTNYSSGRVLDVYGGYSSKSTPVHQYAANGSTAQKWQLVKNAGSSFSFYSAVSGMALDVRGAVAKSGTRLQQYTPNGSDAQKFRLLMTSPSFSEGIVTVRNGSNTYLVMDIYDGCRDDGTRVQLYDPNETFAQKFMIKATDDGLYTIAAIVSGLFVSAAEDGSVSQQALGEAAYQSWRIVPTANGHFAFLSADGKIVLGVSGSAQQGSRLEASVNPFGLSFTWNMLGTEILSSGFYTIASAKNEDYVLDVCGASIENLANVWLYSSNASNAQKFYLRCLGDGWYSITNVWSAMNVDVKNAEAWAGVNIQQYEDNGANAQKWRIVWNGQGGFAFVSVLGSLALGVDGVWQGSNVELREYDLSDLNQCFYLASTRPVAASFSDRIAVLDVIRGPGFNVFKSLKNLSSSTLNRLGNAIDAYECRGVPVGFIMMDLETGSGVSYNIDQQFYSASTIKGPYVAALNRYYPWLLDSWSGTMYDTISVSSNEAYADLRNAFGSDPLKDLIDNTHAWGFDYSTHYVNYSVRDLAKLWTGMSDYFLGEEANAWWCRSVYGSNAAITSRPILSERGPVYAKSGWVDGDTTVHNEGCLVMNNGRPYLMVVMTNQSHYDSSFMANLMRALDQAHADLA